MRKCRLCEKPAEIYISSHNLALCREDFIENFERRVERTIRKFKMLDKRERVLVAISGGKDSLALIHLLNKLGYRATGYHIDLGIGDYSRESLERVREFRKREGVEIIVESVRDEFGMGIGEISKRVKQPPCSVCGTIKRYMFNRAARNFDSIATGHNLDDEIATLMGNVLNWQTEYLARQYPVLESRDSLKKKIKPFVFVSEYETATYAFVENIPYILEECPYSTGAKSIFYKEILNRVEERMTGTKLRFLSGFLKHRHLFLASGERKIDLKPCIKCGYMTTSDICQFCRLKERINDKRRQSWQKFSPE